MGTTNPVTHRLAMKNRFSYCLVQIYDKVTRHNALLFSNIAILGRKLQRALSTATIWYLIENVFNNHRLSIASVYFPMPMASSAQITWKAKGFYIVSCV